MNKAQKCIAVCISACLSLAATGIAEVAQVPPDLLSGEFQQRNGIPEKMFSNHPARTKQPDLELVRQIQNAFETLQHPLRYDIAQTERDLVGTPFGGSSMEQTDIRLKDPTSSILSHQSTLPEVIYALWPYLFTERDAEASVVLLGFDHLNLPGNHADDLPTRKGSDLLKWPKDKAPILRQIKIKCLEHLYGHNYQLEFVEAITLPASTSSPKPESADTHQPPQNSTPPPTTKDNLIGKAPPKEKPTPPAETPQAEKPNTLLYVLLGLFVVVIVAIVLRKARKQ